MTLMRSLLTRGYDDLFLFIKNEVIKLYKKYTAITTTTVTISSMDTLYAPLLVWLRENNIEKDCRNWRYRTAFIDSKQRQVYGPAIGSYNIVYQGKPLSVSVKEENVPMVTEDGNNSKQAIESITLSMRGQGSELKELLKTLFRDYVVKPKSFIEVRSYDGRYWCRSKDLPKKHHNGLILAEGQLEKIERIVRNWQNGKDWYVARDIPYRLGLLFHGKPGTGKTSLVKHIARLTDFNIYVCMAAALSAENFIKSMSEIPKRTIIVIEDIDCLYQGRSKKQSNLVDFSSLLNGLDGLVALEDVILIMTTNHLDQLDSALIRPGRIDEKIEISLCTTEQGQRLFNKFFPDSQMQLDLPDQVYTPAQLQEVFLRSKEDTDVVVNLANVNPNEYSHEKEKLETTLPLVPIGKEPEKPRSKLFWEWLDKRRFRHHPKE